MQKKVGMVSLGCAKNQVDAEVMLGLLREKGYEIVNKSEEADIIIINTCGFIGPAKEESIQAILEQAKYKKTGNCKTLVVTGCLGQRYSRELVQEMPEVDIIIGTGDYSRITEIIETANMRQEKTFISNPSFIEDDSLPRVISTSAGTAYLKIADGCDNHCTYCIIPKLRGRFRSRPISSLINEAKKLARDGISEIILVAQDVTRYGQDSGGQHDLVELLEQLCQIHELRWIRLMYCYPDRITDELIELMAAEEKICNYMDIPIQHINQRILSRMNRTSDSMQIRQLLSKLKSCIPDIVLRTSLITGFPGETEEEFQELENFIKEGYFQHIGVFTYSREEGTRAASFPDQIEDSIKEERRSKLMSVQKRVSKRLMRKRCGQVCDVKIEGKQSEKIYYGRSYGEAPEVDGLVYVHSPYHLKTGDFVKVRITNAFDYDLLGEVYESGK